MEERLVFKRDKKRERGIYRLGWLGLLRVDTGDVLEIVASTAPSQRTISFLLSFPRYQDSNSNQSKAILRTPILKKKKKKKKNESKRV